MALTQKLTELVEDLAILDDPHERLNLVVERARSVPALPAALRNDANRVRGCVSVVWIAAEVRAGRCEFQGDAESPIVRALVVLLCDFFSGFTPEAIANSDVDPLEALGLTRNLTPTRQNGLNSARRSIRAFAQVQVSGPPPTP